MTVLQIFRGRKFGNKVESVYLVHCSACGNDVEVRRTNFDRNRSCGCRNHNKRIEPAVGTGGEIAAESPTRRELKRAEVGEYSNQMKCLEILPGEYSAKRKAVRVHCMACNEESLITHSQFRNNKSCGCGNTQLRGLNMAKQKTLKEQYPEGVKETAFKLPPDAIVSGLPTIFELKMFQCKWSMGVDFEGTRMFCSESTGSSDPDQPYCCQHRLKAYTPYQPSHRIRAYNDRAGIRCS